MSDSVPSPHPPTVARQQQLHHFSKAKHIQNGSEEDGDGSMLERLRRPPEQHLIRLPRPTADEGVRFLVLLGGVLKDG